MDLLPLSYVEDTLGDVAQVVVQAVDGRQNIRINEAGIAYTFSFFKPFYMIRTVLFYESVRLPVDIQRDGGGLVIILLQGFP